MTINRILTGSPLALGLIFASQPALAEKWQTPNQARKSVLAVECTRTGFVTLTIHAPDNSGWTADVAVSARVGSESFALETEGGADTVILSDTRALGISATLMAALQNGGSFVLEGPAVRGASIAARTYPLAGGRAQLARIAQACGLTATAPATSVTPAAGSTIPPEVAKARADIRKECGQTNFRPGFQKTADFNGDGVPEYILDYAEVDCGEAANMFCGSAGCTLDVFVSSASGYRHDYRSNVQGWSLAQANGKAVLVVGLHGSACGRIGAQGCNRRLIWKGGTFTPSR